MKPINQEGVVQTSQVLLAVLSDEEGSTPNKYLEGVVSGKSLLRGLVSGQLIVCQPDAPETAVPEVAEPSEDAAPADIE